MSGRKNNRNNLKKGKNFLAVLNKSVFKTTISISKMKIENEYKILKVSKVNTRFGERIVMELQEYSLFLPAQYIKNFSDEAISDMNLKKNYYVVRVNSRNKLIKFIQKGVAETEENADPKNNDDHDSDDGMDVEHKDEENN